MSKDPAFLFYPGDWSLGTMHMTLIEKGAYMELLMLQFARDKFTLTQAKHMLNGSFDLVWATLQEKFINDGKYYWNERLKDEKEKRSRFTESRRNNALSSKKHNEDMCEHMQEHMENENKDENNNKSVAFKKPNLSEVKLYCTQRNNNVDPIKWYNFYESKGWMIGKNKMKDWKAAVRTWEDSKKDSIKVEFMNPPAR